MNLQNGKNGNGLTSSVTFRRGPQRLFKKLGSGLMVISIMIAFLVNQPHSVRAGCKSTTGDCNTTSIVEQSIG
jgi:hypothetical protein